MQAGQRLEIPLVAGDPLQDREQRHRQLIAQSFVANEVACDGRVSQELGVAEGIGDAVCRERILEVPGISDERPPGTVRLAELPAHTRPAAYRAGCPSRMKCPHEARIE